MRRSIALSLAAFLVGSLLLAVSLPELFQKAKDQFRLGNYAGALATLAALNEQTDKPENEGYRASLRPALAFYRGACLAALDRPAEAREQLQIFLTFSPNATLDPSIYPKKVIAALEESRRGLKQTTEKPEETGALASAYRAFSLAAGQREPTLGEQWADGPVRYLLTSEERRNIGRLADPVSRSEFVTAFWKSRDPKPETPENEFREEFERRVAFADLHFAQDEVRGSLTDRGMVFVLLGPPTYVGRRPLTTGEDTSDPSGMSRFTRHDIVAAQKSAATSAQANASVDQMTGPTSKMQDSAANWREVWHYRQELLPRGVPYQQVDFEFITRKGYGKNILQRDEAALNTVDAARKAGSGARNASR